MCAEACLAVSSAAVVMVEKLVVNGAVETEIALSHLLRQTEAMI